MRKHDRQVCLTKLKYVLSQYSKGLYDKTVETTMYLISMSPIISMTEMRAYKTVNSRRYRQERFCINIMTKLVSAFQLAFIYFF